MSVSSGNGRLRVLGSNFVRCTGGKEAVYACILVVLDNWHHL